MSLTVVGLLVLALMFVLMFAEMPVAFAMAIAGFLGFIYLSSWAGGLNLLALDYCRTFDSYTMSVIPMFIFMGELVFHSGISYRLYHAAYRWLGHIRGGIAMATIMACAGFATVCGSNVATCGTMATLAIPEMRKYDYDPALATGAVCAGSTLGH